jgi:CDP-diacylglycerol--serine O-phosphatidyltransferase
MKTVMILPNIITSFGLACGLFVIFRMNMMDESTFAILRTMTFVLLLAAFADVLDGAVARAVRGESEFGLAFDSLSDAISFGVAPSVLFLSSLTLSSKEVQGIFVLFASMIYTICGVLRLVRFNVNQAKDKEEKNKAFVGLPIPAAAIAFISPNLLFHTPFFVERVNISMQLRGWILACIAIFLAYLMLSKIRFTSIKSFNFRLMSFETVFLGSLLAIFFLYGLIYNLAILLLIVSWGYITVSVLSAPFKDKKMKKEKKLKK